jgi:hypothetical protein
MVRALTLTTLVLSQLALACQPAWGAERQAEVTMNDWQKSAAWRKYKTAYGKACTSNSLRVLTRLEHDLGVNEAAFDRTMAGHPKLASELWSALSARIRDGLDGLRNPPGKRTPRWNDFLVKTLNVFLHESNALRELRAIGAKDPWVDDELANSVLSMRDALEQRSAELERFEPTDPTTQPLVARAREAIAQSKDLLSTPGSRTEPKDR